MSQIAIYQNENGTVEVRLQADTVWLSQDHMSQLFGRERSVITKHIRNVFKEGELDADSVCANFAHTAWDGKTYQVLHYNLDVIISVGYRVKSPQGVQFRQWATRLLREHLTRGYTLNRERLQANASELQAALELVRKAAQTPELTADTGRGLVDIVTRYAHTFLWLQRYDEGLLTDPPSQPGGTLPTVDEARQALARLKSDLMQRGEATDLFARERGDGFLALLGNLDQSVYGEPANPSVEAPHVPGTPIAKFIDRSGPGLQQLAYRTSDIDALSERLRSQGVRLLYEAPRKGTANSRINFIHPKDAGGVLIELVEPAADSEH